MDNTGTSPQTSPQTSDELANLIRTYRTARTPEEQRQALTGIWNKIESFIYSRAKYYKSMCRCGLAVEDLVHEGFFGLVHALDRYDEERGKPLTYIGIWVDREIRRAIINIQSPRLPEYAALAYYRERRIRSDNYRDTGQYPECLDEATVAQQLGVSPNIAREIIHYNRETVSLDNLTPWQQVATTTYDTNDDIDNRSRTLSNAVNQALATLSDRQRTVVLLAYGLDGLCLNPEEIGERIGLSAKRVRVILKDVLEQLRTNQHLIQLLPSTSPTNEPVARAG